MIEYEMNAKGTLGLRKFLPQLGGVVSGAFKKSGIISVAEVSGAMSKKYNLTYRGKDKATDILTFVLKGETLGEIVLTPKLVKERAKQMNCNLAKAAVFLVIHGTLHIMGYVHGNNRDAEKMESKERQLLKKINL
jgi:probable rRNA maturation factor